MNTSIGKYLFLIACFIFWLFLALFSSKLIVDNLTSGHHYSNAVFTLHYLKNSGAAFSLLQNAREFLIIVAIVATTFLFLYVHNHIKAIHLISVSFIGLLSAGIMSKNSNLFLVIQSAVIRRIITYFEVLWFPTILKNVKKR